MMGRGWTGLGRGLATGCGAGGSGRRAAEDAGLVRITATRWGCCCGGGGAAAVGVGRSNPNLCEFSNRPMPKSLKAAGRFRGVGIDGRSAGKREEGGGRMAAGCESSD